VVARLVDPEHLVDDTCPAGSPILVTNLDHQ
jgi:hypothetical protein